MHVHHVERFVVRRNAQNREHRAEDLVCIDGHVGGDIVDQGWAEPVTARLTIDLGVTTIDDDRCARGFAGIDVRGNLVAVHLGNQRAHVGAARTVTRTKLGHALGDLGNQRICNITNGDERRDGHAALTSGTTARVDGCIGGEVAVDRAIAVLLDGLSIQAARRKFPDGPASADAPPAIASGVVPRDGLPPHSNAVHYPTGAPTPRKTYAREIRETNWRTVGATTAAEFAVEPSLRYPAHTFVIGQVSVDYPSESVRRVFADAMGSQAVSTDGRLHDIEQLVEYLDQNPADARKLNWVVNINGEPRYRVRPSGTYANEVFDTLAALVLASTRGSITVASIPGSATADTTTLQSGTVVRDLMVTSLRGIHGWHPAQVAQQALAAVHSDALIDSCGDDTWSRDSLEAANAENRPTIAAESTAAFNWPRLRTPASAEVTSAVADFLQLAYFRADQQPEVSRDRALNFAATNGYQIAAAFLDAMNDNLSYVDYRMEYSPFARVGGNCWDLILCFRDPVKGARAMREYRLTVDVVDTLPVTVGRLRSWAGPRS